MSTTTINKFNVDKALYQEWSASMISSLTTEGLIDFTQREWVPKPKPPPPATFDEASRISWSSDISQVNLDNSNDRVRNQRAFGFIRKHLADELHGMVDDTGGSPFLAWNLLESRFGFNALVQSDRSRIKFQLKNLKMKDHENFMIWFQLFNRLCNTLNMSVAERTDTITVERLLPDRLNQVWTDLRIKKIGFAEATQQLQDYDQSQRDERDREKIIPTFQGRAKSLNNIKDLPERARAVSSANSSAGGGGEGGTSSRDTRQIRETVCLNCNNPGHFARDFKANFCGYCHGFDVGHTSYDCPDRNKKSTSRSQDKKNGSTKMKGILALLRVRSSSHGNRLNEEKSTV